MSSKHALVALASVQRNPEMMPRAGIDPAAVQRYKAAYEADDPLPPIEVVRDAAGQMWLTDGWHRVAAADALGVRDLPAEIVSGEEADAYLRAAGHNATHGRPRDKEDTKAAIVVALRGLLAKGEPWSNLRLASLVRVSDMTIGRHLPAIEQSHPELFNTVEQRTVQSAAKKGNRAAQARDRHRPQREAAEAARVVAADAYPDLDANGMLPVVSLEDDATPLRADAIHDLTLNVVRSAVHEKSLSQQIGEAETTAFSRAMTVKVLRQHLATVLAIDPVDMVNAWVADERQDDLNAVLQTMLDDLTAYVAAVKAVKPQRLRALPRGRRPLPAGADA